MKRALFILLLPILLVSCSTNRCMKSYLKEQITNNKEKNIVSVLTDKKLKISNTLNIYMGRKKGNWNSQAKSFDQKEYDLLIDQFKNDTITEYWSKKESNNFKFISLIKNGGISKYRDSINSHTNKSVYNYTLSKPIFIKNKKQALFSVVVTKQPSTIVDDCVIIMRKENGKWIFLEKVNSTALH